MQKQVMADFEALPLSPFSKPIRAFDGLYPEDEEECQAYWDFIHWAINSEHALLLSIPKQENVYEFWAIDFDISSNDSSAFNTIDYQRLNPDTFNKYHYRIKKIFEKIRDLAMLHSSISNPEGKKNTYQRYKNLVEKEFREPAKSLLATCNKNPKWVDKEKLIPKIAALNSKIRKSKHIWHEHSQLKQAIEDI